MPVGGPPPDPSPRGFFGEEMRKTFDSRARGNGRAARREGRRRVAGQSSRVLTFRLGRDFLVSRRDDRRDGRERRLRPSVSGSGSRVMVHPRRGAKWTRQSGPRASSKDLLGANRRVSCRLRRDSRTSRGSGVSPLDAFVLRRGKRRARSEYASSTSLPRAPASVSRSFMTRRYFRSRQSHFLS